jgi:DNA-binding CsgD family transcriptional regulator
MEHVRAVRPFGYSPREDQILRLIAGGQTDKQIAFALGISRKTVATHLARLYVRGGFHSRTEAVVRWLSTPA